MNAQNSKPILSLKISDLETNPVWEFVDDQEGDETAVRAVKRLPVSTLTGRVVGSKIRLVNGNHVWALIGNLETKNARKNEHFLTVSIERKDRWFALARYHDFDYLEHGPIGLSRFLQLPLDEVFPIFYDVRKHITGDPAALSGTIFKEPKHRLSETEIIALAIP